MVNTAVRQESMLAPRKSGQANPATAWIEPQTVGNGEKSTGFGQLEDRPAVASLAAPANETATGAQQEENISRKQFEVLQQLLEQQRASAVRSQLEFQQIRAIQLRSALASSQTANNTHTLSRVAVFRLKALAVGIVGILLFIVFNYLSIYARHKGLIATINQARKEGQYTRTSAWFVVFAYEYPVFASLRFINRNFPTAVVYAYYTEPFATHMREHPGDWISLMFVYSEQYSDANGREIMCAVGLMYDIEECKTPCGGPSPGFTQYAINIATGGLEGFMFGAIGGNIATAAVGAGIGAVISGVTTYFSTIDEPTDC